MTIKVIYTAIYNFTR